jgi:hypothetical protein
MLSNQKLLKENRQLGWALIPDSAPRWVREHFIAVRSAELSGKSARELRVIEQRSLSRIGATSRVERRSAHVLNPAPRVDAELEALKAKAHGLGQAILSDFRKAGLPVTFDANLRAEAYAAKDAIREDCLAMIAEIKETAKRNGAL